MCPAELLLTIGGTISGFPRKTVIQGVIQDDQPLHSKELYIVIQETSRRRLEAKADTKLAEILATEETKTKEEERSRGEQKKNKRSGQYI